MSGKGSRPRPLSVPRKVYENNWDRIFNKKSIKQDKSKTKKNIYS